MLPHKKNFENGRLILLSVNSSVKNFRAEFWDHIREKRVSKITKNVLYNVINVILT